MSFGVVTFDMLLRRAAARLQAVGSPSPRIDAEVLLSHATGHTVPGCIPGEIVNAPSGSKHDLMRWWLRVSRECQLPI